MKTKVILIIAAITLLSPSKAPAYPNWDIYSDAVIQDGDAYGIVRIYDTPPDHTTVDMTGGLADFIAAYDASTLNVTGGHAQVEAFDNSVINISGGTLSGAAASEHGVVNFSGDADSRSLGALDFGTANMTGGSVDHMAALNSARVNLHAGIVSERLWASDSAVINIYGHELVKTSTGGTYGYGEVSGFLTDDTFISVDLSNSEAYSHINLIEVIYVEIYIYPDTLNLQSNGKWLTCHIWLPEDYNAVDVNSTTVLLQDKVQAEWIWLNEKQNVVMAKFSRSDIQEMLSDMEDVLEIGEVELTVSGELIDGTRFEGKDTIRVINRGNKKK